MAPKATALYNQLYDAYWTFPPLERHAQLIARGDEVLNAVANRHDWAHGNRTGNGPSRQALERVRSEHPELQPGIFTEGATHSYSHVPAWERFEAGLAIRSTHPAHAYFVARVLGLQARSGNTYVLARGSARHASITAALEQADVDDDLVYTEQRLTTWNAALLRERAIVGRLSGVPPRRAIPPPAHGGEYEFWKLHMVGIDTRPGIFACRSYAAELEPALRSASSESAARIGTSPNHLMQQLEGIHFLRAEILGNFLSIRLRAGAYSLLQTSPHEVDILFAALKEKLPLLFTMSAHQSLELIAKKHRRQVQGVLSGKPTPGISAEPQRIATDIFQRVNRTPEVLQAYTASIRGKFILTGPNSFYYIMPGTSRNSFAYITFRLEPNEQFHATTQGAKDAQRLLKIVQEFPNVVSLEDVLTGNTDVGAQYQRLLTMVAKKPTELGRAATHEKGWSITFPEGVDIPEPLPSRTTSRTPPRTPPNSLAIKAANDETINETAQILLTAYARRRGTATTRPDENASDLLATQAVRLLAERNLLTLTTAAEIERQAGKLMKEHFDRVIARHRAQLPKGQTPDAEAEERAQTAFKTQRTEGMTFVSERVTAAIKAQRAAQVTQTTGTAASTTSSTGTKPRRRTSPRSSPATAADLPDIPGHDEPETEHERTTQPSAGGHRTERRLPAAPKLPDTRNRGVPPDARMIR